ncbi:glyceraldehyde-3-phosphate dehydrogenase [Canibacter sp. lx-72]|uniref:glyceraldehyde-3-phosphate dehydrogenase n=1 Tax=Canibacter zhuwentaonis TaxID=2837491 RepID=UPI001BDD5374|nr:glyceraldehyde-3-phosphate dehydrogenase [Canibacter zhuwentaonis]MBT1018001.1 glyceraldehyde-3-phosphate dehydrogenase [Canibacter zhuwentaonis]
MAEKSQEHLNSWNQKIATAENLIPKIGRLYRECDVVLSVHGRSLVGQSPIDIIKAHRRLRHIANAQLSLQDTAALIAELELLGPPPLSLDLALLQQNFLAQDKPLKEFLTAQIATITAQKQQGTDVVLYGFGRIGRLIARIIIDHTGSGNGLNLRAIVVRTGGKGDLDKRANLLRRDSVHGRFHGSIDVDYDNNVIIANGVRIQVIYSNDPSSVDYTSYGINNAILVDNTGIWRDREGLEQYLKAPGIARVLLTAPGKGDLKNIVYGINHTDITDGDQIVSAASCTTNAITPVLKVINDSYGVAHGHVETVHSYTNDQNLIDNFHKGDRRGRGAALNMVITETGAAKAVAKALPEFAGKLTGNAIRVPTPNVSLAILNLQLANATDRDTLNARLKEESLTGKLRTQIDFVTSPEIVSSDFVGANRAGVVDGLATMVNNKTAVVYVWYDNEFGYSCQVVRVIEHIAQAHPAHLPATTVA